MARRTPLETLQIPDPFTKTPPQTPIYPSIIKGVPQPPTEVWLCEVAAVGLSPAPP